MGFKQSERFVATDHSNLHILIYFGTMNSILRSVFLIYFLTHIPITLCVDLQIIFGQYYPETLQKVFAWYLHTYNDQLLAAKPVWLQSFIYAELFVQLPFFFAASYALIFKKNWIRIPAIVYGAHVATTVVPILAEFAFHKSITPPQKLQLLGFYAPYLLIPLLLTWYMAVTALPFGEKKKTN